MIKVIELLGVGNEKEVLTRAAKIMDSIENENVYDGICFAKTLSGDEVQQFKDYVGTLIMPYIESEIEHCIHVGKINDIEEDTYQNLALLVYKNFSSYNNSKTKEYGETYDFATFVKLYTNDAIRSTRAQERGYKSRLDRKRRKIAKSKAKAAAVLGKREGEVTAEEIYRFMPYVTENPLSLKEIKRSIEEYLVDHSLDSCECSSEQGIEDEILIVEEYIEKDFREFIEKMRPMQKYIFLQSYGFCSNKHESMKSNAIGYDPYLLDLAREDVKGQAHIKCEEEEYVEDRYIRKEKERMTIRIRKLIDKMEYSETELRANLMPLLYELQEEMRRKYDL